MNTSLSLNIPQAIFTVFFAIFWGTAANAQPRWRAFAWPYAIQDPASRRRLFLSIAVMNVIPGLYFVGVLLLMSASPWQVQDWAHPAGIQTIGGILPAFAAFGFYRLWLAGILSDPVRYYGFSADNIDTNRYPDLTRNDLDPQWFAGNLIAAAVYIVVSIVPLWVACYVR